MEPYSTLDQAEKAGLEQEAIKTMLYGDHAKDRMAIWSELSKSADVLKYREVVVPEDFTGNETEEEMIELTKEEEIEQKEAAVSRAQRRKLEGKVTFCSVNCLILVYSNCFRKNWMGCW